MHALPADLPKPTDFDVAFVIGLHKSGTSLLVEHLSNHYFDTSRVTNPDERGYGSTVSRYLTRECKVVRQINESYRSYALPSSSTPTEDAFDWAAKRDEMRAFLKRWQGPIVLKAPFFGYSLGDWLYATKALGRRPCVCFAYRNLSDVINEWQKAPYTRELLDQGELERLSAAIHGQIEGAKVAAIEVYEFGYDEIISFRPHVERTT